MNQDKSPLAPGDWVTDERDGERKIFYRVGQVFRDGRFTIDASWDSYRDAPGAYVTECWVESTRTFCPSKHHKCGTPPDKPAPALLPCDVKTTTKTEHMIIMDGVDIIAYLNLAGHDVPDTACVSFDCERARISWETHS